MKELMKMYANYHTHTYRCGHASDTEREYIETALANGITVMGFSDHIPFAFPDGFESGHRVPCTLAEDYVKTLRELKDEYAGRMEIHIGFEAEYYPLHFEKMLSNAVEWGTEYLILGQHFVYNEHPDGRYCGSKGGDEAGLKDYADCLVEGMRTGKFSCLCHPDVYNFGGDSATFLREMERVCAASNETGVPLEINFLGIRDNRHYPREDFWRLAGEMGCTAVFGMDAHRACDAFDGESLVTALDYIDRFGLKLADELQLRKLTD